MSRSKEHLPSIADESGRAAQDRSVVDVESECPAQQASSTSSVRGLVLASHNLVQTIGVISLVVVCAAQAVLESVRLSAFSNADAWWHLRAGLWILQNRAIPRTGLFSQFPSSPWMASSWVYDVVLASAYKLFGLRALPLVLMFGLTALAASIFWAVRGWCGRFWLAVALTAAAIYAIGPMPVPSAFSVALFAIELYLLNEYRRSGRVRSLWVLVPLFAFWANLNIQFVFGLILLAWFVAVQALETLLSHSGAPSDYSFDLKATGIALASAAATVLNPYSYHLYSIARLELYSNTSIKFFSEMRALGFRRPQDYTVLLLVMATVLVLGLLKSVDLFQLGAIAAGMAAGFRFQREIWAIVLPCIVALAFAASKEDRFVAAFANTTKLKRQKAVVAALVLALLVTAGARIGSDKIAQKMRLVTPVAACDFIRHSQLPKPLFNTYDWGGFLTWYLPESPVAIDGRLGLYGDQATYKYFEAVEGKVPLESVPSFATARTVLVERNSALAKALTMLPRLKAQFHVAYSDDLAVVLVRN